MGLFRHTAEYGTRENLVFLLQCQAASRRAPVSAGKKFETSLAARSSTCIEQPAVEVVWLPCIGTAGSLIT